MTYLIFQWPDHLPCAILNGNNALVAGSYKHAIGKILRKYFSKDVVMNLWENRPPKSHEISGFVIKKMPTNAMTSPLSVVLF